MVAAGKDGAWCGTMIVAPLSDIHRHYHGARLYTVRHPPPLSRCSIIHYRNPPPLSWCSIVHYRTSTTTIMVLHHTLLDIHRRYNGMSPYTIATRRHYHGAPPYMMVKRPHYLGSLLYTTVSLCHYPASTLRCAHKFCPLHLTLRLRFPILVIKYA